MSDSIPPIRYIPPIHRLNQKGKTGDKKGDKGGKQCFTNYMSSKDEEANGKGSNQEDERHKDSGQDKLEDKDSLQTRNEEDPDGNCGTILDTEV